MIESHSSMKKTISIHIRLYFLLMILAAAIPRCSAANSNSSSHGPFFIQVHFTSPLSSLSAAAVEDILHGRIKNFKQLGGPNRRISLYADSSIYERLLKKYPGLRARQANFNSNRKLAANRSFLGISGIPGLKPHFKIMYVDNSLPWGRLQKEYTLLKNSTYPLMLKGLPPWEENKALTIVQTGVTALTRHFVKAVDKAVAGGGDPLYPIRFTGAITRQADIAMTSNEVSFKSPCPYRGQTLRFCSPDKYFTLLTKSGFTLIELTGNHNNDFGTVYNNRSIDMLEKNSMAWFGGGRNRADAEAVRFIKKKSLTIGFTGFNEYGPSIAWATRTKPGAARLSKKLFAASVKQAVKKAPIVFVTLQSGNETNPRPSKSQVRYFHRAVNLGATIIVSSSSHRVMGLEFYKGKLISYGLGNFLFDQMHTIHYRRGLIARHHFYGTNHISTEFIPYIIHNHSQPRLLHGKQARDLMREVFRHSRGYVWGR
ncbi:MAG: hypothetical protein GY754_35620 [bacterium]|nr:hypothetical protein [bacterium]